jgi:hypothetical protein
MKKKQATVNTKIVNTKIVFSEPQREFLAAQAEFLNAGTGPFQLTGMAMNWGLQEVSDYARVRFYVETADDVWLQIADVRRGA